jgi:hypothetical protein
MDDVSFTVASGTAVTLAGARGSGRPGQNFPSMSALEAHGMVRELLAWHAGLIILREPVLMPDVSLRAGVLRLLAKQSFTTRETTTPAAARRGGESLAPRVAGAQAIRHTTALQTRGRCAT